MNSIGKMPVAVGMMVFGFVGMVVSAANSWAVPGTISVIAVFAGFVWFCLIWDKVVKMITPLKSYDKRVRRLEEREREREDYRNLKDKSIDNKLNALEKKSNQNIKGQVIYINRKEA